MTEVSYPFDLGAGSAINATQWRAMARRWRGSGVNKGDQNGLAVAAGTGLQTTVASGSGFVLGHFYNNDASLPLAHSAADATFGRLDLVVLELNLTDLNAPAITAKVVTGTPSGSPALPSLTQSSTIYQIPLAQVAVAALATSVGTVTDLRPWAGARRRIVDGASGGTATTTSVGTYVDMTTMTTGSFYSDGGDIDVRFCGTISNSGAGGQTFIGLSLDGAADVLIGRAQSDSANQVIPFSASHLFQSVSAGFHTIKVRWQVSAGTSSADNTRKILWSEAL